MQSREVLWLLFVIYFILAQKYNQNLFFPKLNISYFIRRIDLGLNFMDLHFRINLCHKKTFQIKLRVWDISFC